MARLSVNLNKVALLRNAREELNYPDVVEVAKCAIGAGCRGLTIHPRADERHATLADIRALSAIPEVSEGLVALNIEGNFRPELVAIIKECTVDQFTLVPVRDGEKTTERGWDLQQDGEQLLQEVQRSFPGTNIRLSLFIDAVPEMVEVASRNGFGAVEFHTKHYAHSYDDPKSRDEIVRQIGKCASLAGDLGLKVNLGHDLNVRNLAYIVNAIKPDEVSIGQSLIAEAIVAGIASTVQEYLQITN